MQDRPPGRKANPGRPRRKDDLAALKPSNAAVRRVLVESHRDLLSFLRRRLGSSDEAEEVFQRFVLRALERESDLRDIHMVRGWLGRILATTIIDHQRRAIVRRRRETAVKSDELNQMTAVEPDQEVDKAVCDCLYKLLPTLRTQYAEVIWRADLLGEPRGRIAASLGTTLNNVTVRLHRARLALKKRLEEMCQTCPTHGFLDCGCDFAPSRRQRGRSSRPL